MGAAKMSDVSTNGLPASYASFPIYFFHDTAWLRKTDKGLRYVQILDGK